MNKMKSYVIVCELMILVSSSSFSQGLFEGKRKGFTVGNNIVYSNTTSSTLRIFTRKNNGVPEYLSLNETNSNVSNVDFSNLNFGYVIKSKNNNFHNFELTKLDYKRDFWYSRTNERNRVYFTNGMLSNTFNIFAKYSFDLLLVKNENKKIFPSIGYSIEPFFSRIILRPIVTTSYSTNISIIGSNLSLVPKISFKLTNDLLFTVSTLVSYTVNLNYERKINPTQPINAQRQHWTSGDWNPEVGLRFGITYLIPSKETEEDTKGKKSTKKIPPKGRKVGVYKNKRY